MANNIEVAKQITPEKLKKLSDIHLVWLIEVAEAGLRNSWKDHKDAPLVRKVIKMMKTELKGRK
jgi:sulfur relay (sulfurtransferase) DsrC/TusE family protein